MLFSKEKSNIQPLARLQKWAIQGGLMALMGMCGNLLDAQAQIPLGEWKHYFPNAYAVGAEQGNELFHSGIGNFVNKNPKRLLHLYSGLAGVDPDYHNQVPPAFLRIQTSKDGTGSILSLGGNQPIHEKTGIEFRVGENESTGFSTFPKQEQLGQISTVELPLGSPLAPIDFIRNNYYFGNKAISPRGLDIKTQRIGFSGTELYEDMLALRILSAQIKRSYMSSLDGRTIESPMNYSGVYYNPLSQVFHQPRIGIATELPRSIVHIGEDLTIHSGKPHNQASWIGQNIYWDYQGDQLDKTPSIKTIYPGPSSGVFFRSGGITLCARDLAVAEAPFITETSGVLHGLHVRSSNGFIGLGTMNPKERLDVIGNGRLSGRLAIGKELDNAKPNIILDVAGGNATQPNTIRFGKTNSDPSFNNISDATAHLYVDGGIAARELLITLDNWADYVFKPDYQLPALEEVENHIQQKQHLPGVPSEKEVLEKGVKIGEMQTILLRKVEELTLYMLQMKKENTRLQKELEQLRTTVEQR